MSRHIVVVGGGAMGSSAAWHLAARGVRVTLFEQFTPGHDRGSSHGSSRIFRLAYPDPFYVTLAARSLPLWRRLEEETGRPLLNLTGAVDHGPAPVTTALHDALTALGRPSQLLAPAQAAERWPGLRADTSALFHPEAGRLHADDAVTAFQQAARQHGARIRHGVKVTRLAVRGERAEVVTDGEEAVIADGVVVAAGGWTPGRLAGLVTGMPRMRITQEQPAHFPAADALDWPSFIHHGGAGLPPGTAVYGLGSTDGVKAGFHGVGPLVDPDHRDRTIDATALGYLRQYATRWLPGVDPTAPAATTCLYTTTPDEDFVIDRQGPLTVLAGFSGHGFKFASLVGALAADLVGGAPGLGRFALGRTVQAGPGRITPAGPGRPAPRSTNGDPR
ncbi:FAD-dependent oxidoreductase [Streptomyces sp. H39-S7]|uniref:FAD-dependent oxidoreductase n=1 Tax=Streptomyces sp. H39-S7 TaxID=3004357 RepID=UPI0022AF8A72|nr:FAD-dependent oxidoreductase [Streptomyces sp. H39-S7]MCZ4123407.1 FAD-dependent oxidoreductase [Streptomyces sp. H39-S7]